ncbi:B12-binding domain-containing radical SAM protein [Vulcanibacillus modesticaldus]|uniref:B12-binding domain-containing radical SAM protein n=1 Tax=Vulcanibacillus modesticaldus TaxID=337097 RepID=A0A1D2YSU5_9BACI|nr:B12-binding domain-containing radical SAM protein [Vulcanibacillus modesticaldus]OEF98084.1 B12-binding domain-containing radical SAM protein [Vulcanibacillus modesticaldus]
MKIILTTLNAKYIHSSLALRYLKAYSQRDFKEIEIVEYSIKEPLMNILSELYQKQPDVIGFSCYIWNIEETIDLIKMLKKVMPEVKIVLGGPEVSYDIPYWFKRVREIDFIVYGEGEITFSQLLKAIEKETGYQSVFGVAYRNQDGYIINPPQEKANLDELPSPYNDLDDLRNLKDKIVYFEASRGCPYSCAYCLSSLETNVRYFTIERVKDDLLKIINSGVKTVKFVDRTFNLHKKFALEIFKFLIENHRGTVFQFEITADIMKPELIDFLVKNAPKGIFRFEIGVQSTNEHTNSLINRKQNFKRLSETVIKLKQNNNMDLHLDLIAGLPKEDYNSFKRTFNDVFALKPEELQLGFLKLLRGTAIWLEADKYGYVYMDKPPYEVLQNDVLTFKDVIRIKSMEDILEKYWNAHRMDKTVEYLINVEFNTPFDFFQEFGDYWSGKGWNRIGHQLEALFVRLRDFLLERNIKNLEFVLDLMKFDYFLNHKNKPRKTWWEFTISKQDQNQLIRELAEKPHLVSGEFENLDLNEKELHKHIMIDILKYDLEGYLKDGMIKEQRTLLIAYYNSPNFPKYFFKKLI